MIKPRSFEAFFTKEMGRVCVFGFSCSLLASLYDRLQNSGEILWAFVGISNVGDVLGPSISPKKELPVKGNENRD